MELTGGEPDVVGHDKKTGEYVFYDCSAESSKGRRSTCYDREALEARKEHKPKNSAMDMAAAMGIEILTEAPYRVLQTLGDFSRGTPPRPRRSWSTSSNEPNGPSFWTNRSLNCPSVAPGQANSVRRGSFDLIDDEHVHLFAARFELELELFLERREDRYRGVRLISSRERCAP
jgi:hypothetical protein